MIIYGWNSKNIKQAPLESYVCPNCNEKNSTLTIFAHYAHVFWIPLFPYKKSAQIVCANCKLESSEKTLSDETKGTIKQLKSAVGIPKYLFSGLVLIVLLVGYLTYTVNQNAELKQAYIDNPQIGDVYIIEDTEETSEYNHFLLKVSDIVDDRLWVSFSSYTYNGIVQELDQADGFYDIMYSMHKNGLQEYDQTGELKKVIRDYTPETGFDRVIEFVELDTLAGD